MNAISYKITLRRGGPLFPGTGSRARRVRERPCMEADKGCVLHRPSSLWAWGRPWLASTTMSVSAVGPPCSKPAKPQSRLSIVQKHREAPKSQAPEPRRRGVWIPPPAQASLLLSFLELSGNEMIAQKGYFPNLYSNMEDDPSHCSLSGPYHPTSVSVHFKDRPRTSPPCAPKLLRGA